MTPHASHDADARGGGRVPSVLIGAARALALAPAPFLGEAALLGRAGRSCLAPCLGGDRGGGQQRYQPVERIAPVLLLRAKTLRLDDDHAVPCHPPPGKAGEALVLRTAQRRATGGVEAELRRARHLVDVLPARTGGGDAIELDRAVVDRQMLRDSEHCSL